MLPENAAALVGAGMLSVLLFPLFAIKLRGTRLARDPAAASREGSSPLSSRSRALLDRRLEVVRRGWQLRHGRRRVGCRLEERVLDGGNEPRRVGRARLGGSEQGRSSESHHACRAARAAAHSISATSTQEAAITPAITAASSSAMAAAVATAIRKRTSSRRRGTAGRRRTGAPTELTQAYEEGGVELAGSSFQPGSEAGKPGPPSRRDVGPEGLDLIGQFTDDVGELPIGLAAVSRLLGRAHAAGPWSFIASIASRAFAWTRARRSSSVSSTSGTARRLRLSLRPPACGGAPRRIARLDRVTISFGCRGGRSGRIDGWRGALGALTALTQAYDGVAAESPGSSLQPGSEAGGPARRVGARRPEGLDPDRTAHGRRRRAPRSGSRPCAVCSVAVTPPALRRSSRPSPRAPLHGRARALLERLAGSRRRRRLGLAVRPPACGGAPRLGSAAGRATISSAAGVVGADARRVSRSPSVSRACARAQRCRRFLRTTRVNASRERWYRARRWDGGDERRGPPR